MGRATILLMWSFKSLLPVIEGMRRDGLPVSPVVSAPLIVDLPFHHTCTTEHSSELLFEWIVVSSKGQGHTYVATNFLMTAFNKNV